MDDVKIGDWCNPWNLKGERATGAAPPAALWASDPTGFGQVGCMYTAQGFEYDYAGVIMGPDLVRRGDRWVVDRTASKDPVLTRRAQVINADVKRLIRNVYKVLLTRGMLGWGSTRRIQRPVSSLLILCTRHRQVSAIAEAWFVPVPDAPAVPVPTVAPPTSLDYEVMSVRSFSVNAHHRGRRQRVRHPRTRHRDTRGTPKALLACANRNKTVRGFSPPTERRGQTHDDDWKVTSATRLVAMRIGLVTSAWGPRFGGINSFNHDLACALARLMAADVSCFTVHPSSNDVLEANKEQVNLIHLTPGNEGGTLDPSRAYELAHISQNQTEVDWWIGHDAISGSLAVEAAALTRAKAAIIQHTDYSSYAALKGAKPVEILRREAEEKVTLARADALFAVGPKLVSAAKDRVGLGETEKNIVELVPGLAVIPRNINPPGTFRAITMGRLDPEADRIKQAKLAVKSFGNLVSEVPDFLGPDPRITVIGLNEEALVNKRSKRPSEQQSLLGIAAETAGRAVNVLGHPYTESRETLYGVLADSSVCLMLSVHEGFGLVGWEAIAADVPLILSTNSGLYQFLRREGGAALGCVFPVQVRGSAGPDTHTRRDVADVTKALRQVALNPQLAKDSASSLRRQLEGYTWTRTAETLLQAISPGITTSARQSSKSTAERIAATLPPSNLPERTDSFFGRRELLAQVTRDIKAHSSRLLTIVGPPGAGTSRFALELAHTVVDSFDERVYYVDLGNISDPNLVVATVLRVLKADVRDPILEGLQELLSETPTLIVLDGFEQLTEASNAIAEMVRSIKSLTLVVASREPLRVLGEREIGLSPLNNGEAAELLAERSGIPLTGSEQDPLRVLCARVDNLPLAIELLAPHARHLGAGELLRVLAASTDVPNRRRDVPERHRSLRATIAWSQRLLSADQNSVFRRLSVFRDGASFEALAYVAGLESASTLLRIELVESLMDRHLLYSRELGGERRYFMLQTIREYAAETLESDAAEWSLTSARHAEYFLQLAQRDIDPMHGPLDERTWLGLERDHENLHVAAKYLQSIGNAGASVMVATRLAALWWSRDCSHGWDWLRSLDPGPDADVSAEDYSCFLRWRARIGLRLGRLFEAADFLREGLRLAEQAGSSEVAAEMGADLALISMERCEWMVALGLLTDSHARFERLTPSRGLAGVLDSLGVVALETGRPADASNYLASALALYRELQDVAGAGWVHLDLARVCTATGSLEMAREQSMSALTVAERIGDQSLMCWASMFYAMALEAVEPNDPSTPVEFLSNAIAIAALLRDDRLRILSIETMAFFKRRTKGQVVARAVGATAAARSRLTLPAAPSEQERLVRLASDLQVLIGVKAYEESLEEGSVLSLTEAAELVMGG